MLTEVEFFLLSLLPDSDCPLSVLLPEARRITPRSRDVSVDDVVEAIGSLERRGLIRVVACDPDEAGFREPSQDERAQIFAEYRTDIRSASVVRQILDRIDLWLELTEQGRQDLFTDGRSAGAYSIED